MMWIIIINGMSHVKCDFSKKKKSLFRN